jgi:hypothetical protein
MKSLILVYLLLKISLENNCISKTNCHSKMILNMHYNNHNYCKKYNYYNYYSFNSNFKNKCNLNEMNENKKLKKSKSLEFNELTENNNNRNSNAKEKSFAVKSSQNLNEDYQKFIQNDKDEIDQSKLVESIKPDEIKVKQISEEDKIKLEKIVIKYF